MIKRHVRMAVCVNVRYKCAFIHAAYNFLELMQPARERECEREKENVWKRERMKGTWDRERPRMQNVVRTRPAVIVVCVSHARIFDVIFGFEAAAIGEDDNTRRAIKPFDLCRAIERDDDLDGFWQKTNPVSFKIISTISSFLHRWLQN